MKVYLPWLITSLTLVAVVYLVVSTNFDDQVVQESMVTTRNNFSIKSLISGLPQESMDKRFPYQRYLDSANIEDVQSLKSDLADLNTQFPNAAMSNQAILALALTDSLLEKDKKNLESFNPKFLSRKLQWAEKFNAYSVIDKDNSPLFASVYNFWGSVISDKLKEYSQKDPDLKYNFQFKYLKSRCDEKRFSVPVKVTPTEKVMFNLLSNKWAHLINASWQQASRLQLTVLLILSLITFYGYYLIVLKLVKKYENK